MSNWLYEELQSEIGKKTIQKIQIPEYITDNLKFKLFDWQINAIQNFIAFDNPEYEFGKNNSYNHLLFNMATGTGKTLIMASLILYYYKKGYRNFIFFVNQNNIVDKTENNFIDKNHNKYLFNQKIIIDENSVEIKKVETFSDNTENIEIKFISIQQLHNDIYKVGENKIYLEYLQKRNIIMLGDEAHHLNADTKAGKNEIQTSLDSDFTEEIKTGAKTEVIEKSWENTIINKILKKENKFSDNKNVLLEFTATLPNGKEVEEKYKDKVIYRFDLKDFLLAGYTKEINLLSASFDKKERILTALLFDWYRKEIAIKYNITNFKGVILFRSAKIDDSEKDFEEFLDIIENLSATDFEYLNNFSQKVREGEASYEKGGSRLNQIVKYLNQNYLKDEKINYSSLISHIKHEYKKENCRITNSKDKSAKGRKGEEKTTQEQDQELNNLEDKNNKIKAIFTVYRLTEGWDVLNLFDIVRLHDGRTVVDKKAGPGTVSEVQLIGRGVRYFPFNFQDKLKNKRKFDNDLNHELRVLEELYYHSIDENNYINELKSELRKHDLVDDGKIVKKFKLKDKFKDTTFFNNFKLLINKKANNPERRKKDLEDLKNNFNFSYKVSNLHLKEETIDFSDDENDIIRGETEITDNRTEKIKLSDEKIFSKHIIKKSINFLSKNYNSFYRFEILKNELDINSIDDLLKEEFLGNFELNIVIPKDSKIDDLDNKNIFKCLVKFFRQIEIELKKLSNPYIGTEFDFTDFKEL
ncbi:MAG: DEAD/DEAH box helicase family protein, partial [Candidatus Gracilibacteria bacterium]|nr:DEAD/DEAH box helicase family protein [Candidatus Gracilibacteria bacterium]